MLCLLALAPMLAMPSASAAPPASGYPAKAVTIVVPYAAGGATDAMIRPIAEALSIQWKQPVIVDNRPGANGIIALATIFGLRVEQVNMEVVVVSQAEVDRHFGVYERMLAEKLGVVPPIQ